MVDEEEKILIPIRSKFKNKWPLCYDFSCGESVQSGEMYEEAIKRGIEEELGVKNLDVFEISYLTLKDDAPCF